MFLSVVLNSAVKSGDLFLKMAWIVPNLALQNKQDIYITPPIWKVRILLCALIVSDYVLLYVTLIAPPQWYCITDVKLLGIHGFAILSLVLIVSKKENNIIVVNRLIVNLSLNIVDLLAFISGPISMLFSLQIHSKYATQHFIQESISQM